MSRLPIHAVAIVLCGLRCLAGEREAASWDNFNAPVMSLRSSRPLLPATAPATSPATAAHRLPAPSLTLEPPAPLATGSGMDSGLFSGTDNGRWRLSPTVERSAESMRQEWADLDSKRLADERAREGIWNKTLRTVFPEPDTFRMGTHTIGGGLPTAIRTRNPFALFNPAFLGISF